MMGVLDQIWWERFWRPPLEWLCYKILRVSSLVFFSVRGVFLSVFFVSLSFCVARARAVSLLLFFFHRRQRTRVEKIWRCFGRWWRKLGFWTYAVMYKKVPFLCTSESWTDAFLFVSTLNKACVGKKRKERERIDFRWRWWWENVNVCHCYLKSTWLIHSNLSQTISKSRLLILTLLLLLLTLFFTFRLLRYKDVIELSSDCERDSTRSPREWYNNCYSVRRFVHHRRKR